MQPAKQVAKQVAASTNSMTPILRYVPKSHPREGESPFSGVVRGNAEGKAMKKDSGANLSTRKESVTLPTQNMNQPKVSRHPLPGFLF